MILTNALEQQIVTTLCDSLRPKAIWLFGSQAQGKAQDEGSDVDLCIVVEDGLDIYLETIKAYKALRALHVPKDLVVRSQEGFQTRSEWTNSLESEIRKTGKLLFAA